MTDIKRLSSAPHLTDGNPFLQRAWGMLQEERRAAAATAEQRRDRVYRDAKTLVLEGLRIAFVWPDLNPLILEARMDDDLRADDLTPMPRDCWFALGKRNRTLVVCRPSIDVLQMGVHCPACADQQPPDIELTIGVMLADRRDNVRSNMLTLGHLIDQAAQHQDCPGVDPLHDGRA